MLASTAASLPDNPLAFKTNCIGGASVFSGLTDHGSTDHMDLLFQDCTAHIICQFLLYYVEHIYVYVFVCFVYVIYYDSQVRFYVTG